MEECSNVVEEEVRTVTEEGGEDVPDPDRSEMEENADQSESVPTDPIMKIPNEIWVLILSQLSQKELVQARLVWKKFREVIDSHFEFTVIVHDGKTDLDRVYELRIRDCLITRLLQDRDIFQYPALIRRIRFWGPIDINCFQRIMDTVTSVEELSLTKFALMQDDLVGRRRLQGFSKIKKLELLGYMCKDESRVVAKNSTKIFSYNMPDLEKLTVNFHCDITSINRIALAFLEFIARHNKLHNLQVSLVPEADHPNDSFNARTMCVVIPKSVEESLQQVQLNMLRITTSTKDLPIWTALLNAQTHLQDLRMHLSEGGLLTLHTAYVVGIPYDMVKTPLLQNAATLTFVELKDLRLTPVNGSLVDATPIDASVFRTASNLKRLILFRNVDDYRRFPPYPDQPNIVNLNMLPSNIETLEISRFYCLSDELQYCVDFLENLKNIVLLHTGSLSQLGVHGGIVASICNKPQIQTMNVTPLNYHHTADNKKFDKAKLKYQFNDGDHLYYDFERYRKGLPQPRPPTVVSVEPNPEPSRQRPLNTCARSRISNYRCNAARRYMALDRFFEDGGRPGRSARLTCRCMEQEQEPSILFQSLDLCLDEGLFMVDPWPLTRSVRQRRFSGDSALLEVLRRERDETSSQESPRGKPIRPYPFARMY